MILRVPIFIFTYMLLLCCESGTNYDDDNKFDNMPISFDYIEYEEGRLPVDGN
jgi:hypothetical protein